MVSLVTWLLSGNETLKWLSLLTTLMQKSIWWWQYSVGYSPPPPPPHTHPTSWNLSPCQYLSEDNLALTKSNEQIKNRYQQKLKATLTQQTCCETLTYVIPTETKRQALHGDTGTYSLGLGVIITLNHKCMTQFNIYFYMNSKPTIWLAQDHTWTWSIEMKKI